VFIQALVLLAIAAIGVALYFILPAQQSENIEGPDASDIERFNR
jgi:hypothetical protein